MWGIDVIHPITGVRARIRIVGHGYDAEGNVQMVRVTEFPTGLACGRGGESYPRRFDRAVAAARWMVGDYDCVHCGRPIHWIPEPRRVYVHNHNDTMACDGDRTVAEVEFPV